MIRSTLVVLLSLGLVSCTDTPVGPDIWSLSRTDANSHEVFLGGHYTLEACQRAGYRLFTQMGGDNSVLQCRLNCRSLPNKPMTCEATEPVG
jgi:hypothetical protein